MEAIEAIYFYDVDSCATAMEAIRRAGIAVVRPHPATDEHGLSSHGFILPVQGQAAVHVQRALETQFDGPWKLI